MTNRIRVDFPNIDHDTPFAPSLFNYEFEPLARSPKELFVFFQCFPL